MALLEKEFGPVEGARPALEIVKNPAPVAANDPPTVRPPIFALGPLETRRRAAQN